MHQQALEQLESALISIEAYANRQYFLGVLCGKAAVYHELKLINTEQYQDFCDRGNSLLRNLNATDRNA